MGLFSRKFKEPIRGTATVAASTACPSHASSANCRMDLVISLPGVPATPTTRTMMVRADKWPYPGTVLPIEVDAAKPSRLRVLWEEVPSGRSRGVAAAQELADRMNGVAGAATGTGATNETWTTGETWAQDGVPAAGGLPTAGAPAPGALPGGFTIPPGARVVSSSTTINGQPASADQIAAIESLTGMDLNGDGIVGPPRQ